jgi:hypothetical protein
MRSLKIPQNGSFQLLVVGIQPSQNVSAGFQHFPQNGFCVFSLLEIADYLKIIFPLVVAENVINGISAELTDSQNAVINEHS